MIQRFLRLAAATIVAAVIGGTAAFAGEEPKELIQRLGGEAITLAAKKETTTDERLEGFERLFQKGFDVPLVSRIVMGRYWRVATPAQQEEFINLFHRYMVATYADRLNAYSGQTFQITGEQALSDRETVVKSVVEQPGGPSFKVDWRVLDRNDEHRIVDVIVEGVSMAITHRSEFASVIAKTGQVETLLEQLRARAGKG